MHQLFGLSHRERSCTNLLYCRKDYLGSVEHQQNLGVAHRQFALLDRLLNRLRETQEANQVCNRDPVLAGLLRHLLLGEAEFAGEPIKGAGDRKSTRLNSSHMSISYAVFCLKKKKTKTFT